MLCRPELATSCNSLSLLRSDTDYAKVPRCSIANRLSLICTDPSLSIDALLQSYLWRWDIEVNFRDQKSLLGVGEAQVRNPHSVQSQPAVAIAAYGLLLLAPAQSNLKALSQPKWRSDPQRKRLSTASLINLLRHELWSASIRPEPFTHFSSHPSRDHNPQKPQPNLSSAVFYAAA